MKNYCFLIFSILFLTACQEKPYTQTYLMQNPSILKAEIAACQTSEERTPAQIDRCRKIVSAANAFVEILNEQQSNPEQFGEKIIDAEVKLNKLAEEIRTLKSSNEQSQQAQTKLKELQSQYASLSDEVKIYLAVVGVNSPE